MLAAIELVTDKAKDASAGGAPAGDAAVRPRVEQGLILRAFTKGVFGYAPPLCCTEDEIDQIVAHAPGAGPDIAGPRYPRGACLMALLLKSPPSGRPLEADLRRRRRADRDRRGRGDRPGQHDPSGLLDPAR